MQRAPWGRGIILPGPGGMPVAPTPLPPTRPQLQELVINHIAGMLTTERAQQPAPFDPAAFHRAARQHMQFNWPIGDSEPGTIAQVVGDARQVALAATTRRR